MRKIGKYQRALYANIAAAGDVGCNLLSRAESNALAGLVSRGMAEVDGDVARIVPPPALPLEARESLKAEPDPLLLEDLTQRTDAPTARREQKRPTLICVSVSETAHARLIEVGPESVRSLLSEIVRLGLSRSAEVLAPNESGNDGGHHVYGVAIPDEWTESIKGKEQTGRTGKIIAAATKDWDAALAALRAAR